MDTITIINIINTLVMIVLFPIALYNFFKKAQKWKMQNGQWNPVQLYMIAIFACIVWVIFIEFIELMANFSIITENPFNYTRSSLVDIDIFSIGSILATAFCISLIAY